MPRILIVEDEADIAAPLADDLEIDGYEVEIASDGELACRRAREARWDLILLDVMLPGKDGFEVCRSLRRAGLATPLILLTARAQEAEKILGLELGADDYVTKPFSPRELRARIKAVLRRFSAAREEGYRFGDIEVNFARAEVRRAGELVEITPLEFRLLAAFIERRGRVLSRDQLLDAAWDSGTHVTDRAVDAHIVNLRRKIEPHPAEPKYVLSIRGMGYRFDG
jgi:DNA-binding response OmpR family regulator